MLTEIYIEALLVDEELADQVWDTWYSEDIDDFVAYVAWSWVADMSQPQIPAYRAGTG